MKRLCVIFIIGFCLIITALPVLADNKLMITAAAKLNNLSVSDSFFDESEPTNIKEWALNITGDLYPADDLLINISHTLAFAYNLDDGQNADSNDTEAAILYKFFTDDSMSVYGGVGVHLIENNFKDLLIIKRLSGQGFIAATQVNFYLMDNLIIRADITANPFYKWDYQQGDNKGATKGAYYNYQLSLKYDINQNWSVHLGYAGTRISTKKFELNDNIIPDNNLVRGGFVLGASHPF